jgi:hypothetical protein
VEPGCVGVGVGVEPGGSVAVGVGLELPVGVLVGVADGLLVGLDDGLGVGLGGGGAPVQVIETVAGHEAMVARTTRRPDTFPNDTVTCVWPFESVTVVDGDTRSSDDSDVRKSQRTDWNGTGAPVCESRTIALTVAVWLQSTDDGASSWTAYGFWPI